MSKPIADYAMIGDRRSAALVARDGSIDWLCWPRFDSDACFAALLGDDRHGCWKLGPVKTPQETSRRYLPDTLILETRHVTDDGAITVTDFMPTDTVHRAIIRRIVGESGIVEVKLSFLARFDYGHLPPWRRLDGRKAVAVIGPDLLVLHGDVALAEDGEEIVARFHLRAGETRVFVLQYGLSYEGEPAMLDPERSLRATERAWRDWIGPFEARGPWSDAIKRSLITLQALTHPDTGGIIAAPTLGLPEIPGGPANWDYRYSWVRDSALTLSAFLRTGFTDEAKAWHSWLLRTVAGTPGEMRTMYRFDGAIHIESRDMPWLPGYDGARPVCSGNAAATQRQLDIYGEVLDALYLAAQAGLDEQRPWDLRVEEGIAHHVELVWRKPDQGIWELRGSARHYTHSKVMAWVAIDRFLKLPAAAEIPSERRQRFEELGATIHDEICRRAFDAARQSFVDAYDGHELDASLLRLPLVGFLPATAPHMQATIQAIERELTEGGLVRRWRRSAKRADEGAFLACSCWLADCLALSRRWDEAQGYLERVLAKQNDVGLLAEEWDCREGRLMGNFPQAFSHIALINTALRLNGQ